MGKTYRDDPYHEPPKKKKKRSTGVPGEMGKQRLDRPSKRRGLDTGGVPMQQWPQQPMMPMNPMPNPQQQTQFQQQRPFG